MTPSATPPEDTPDWARPLLERNIAMAGQLAEAGLELAMAAKDQALTPDVAIEPARFEGMSRAFARLSRSTRLSMMLQDRQIKDLIALDKGEVPEAGRDRDNEIRQIVSIIVDPRDDPETRERLDREIMERLERESEAIETAALSCPAGEHLTIILKDLGREADLAAESWAREEAAGGWPLSGLADGKPDPASFETPLRRSSG